MSLSAFLVIYVLGGITFIPLVLSVAFLHAYLTQPQWTGSSPNANASDKNEHHVPDSDGKPSAADFEGLPSELKTRTHVPDVAAGYFAVCREYVPGGINGKPPERTTPAGAVVASESPSVYQSMYRSIFDRNKTTSPSIEAANNKSKKARNVFYVVLRLGHLMLYDDSEQLEVRHVISLAHYDVDIYSGGEAIPEGELWIKRNCIRLASRRQSDGTIPESRKPFYLFSENCSEKEDFYHAILQSQEHRAGSSQPQLTPLKFDTPDLVKLVQQLHADEENLNTRWINALIGRLFLALYKTKDIENTIWTKMTKKIARVPKPALISSINLVKVDMGTLPPFITNPKLKELTVDGDLLIEADVSYKGNFRVEISAIARIDLGTRFKAREVTLVLATSLRKLDGHILVRIKPPPSNRIWVTFETAPKMEFFLEPIVSSRQITYGVILRAIESRLREVVSETLVYPNWDDIQFSDTIANQLRGGIWSDSSKDHSKHNIATKIEEEIALRAAEHHSDTEELESTVPIVPKNEPPKISRKPTASSAESSDTQSTAYSSAVDKTPIKPKAMRSGSFANAASPTVDMSPTLASATKSETQVDAASSMKTTMSRSQPTTPAESPVGSLEQPSVMRSRARGSASSADVYTTEGEEGLLSEPMHTVLDAATFPMTSSASMESADTASTRSYGKPGHRTSSSLPRNTFASTDKRQMINQGFNTATAAAKKWFAKQSQEAPSPKPSTSRESLQTVDDITQDNDKDSISGLSTLSTARSHVNAPLGSPAHPIGRGQPLPPPGTPLPGPQKPEKRNAGWSVPTAATFANLAKRKPVPVKAQSQQQSTEPSPPKEPISPPPPQLPARPPLAPMHSSHSHSSSHHRQASVGTAAMGVRRKSTSNHALSQSTARRQRRSVTDAAIRNGNGNGNGNGHGEGNGHHDPGMLVVEAPILDTSAPTTPTGIDYPSTEPRKDLGHRGRGSSNATADDSVNLDPPRRSMEDEGVFQGMEGVS
ncbi:hypothetical protein BU24DRAFT_446800 [Aaosphaeria arxii CBS 175.79]|uniref:SMP-LTD domain-containing protein n=1 Tax=Aaosphaeria arxii CBS 175.79 TaxID=1450172 RepID=A0A6A5YB19_9PLEO|nr:uncharacterized protein BU24DRAFT_446800 [Aaosphaeria arxii CBS 175.79]KAF2021891.1 hypothetical protein BU24DRAFT_446800 [Aaosphaeria arxii CBS 175.79]